jgi:hypothetical protein
LADRDSWIRGEEVIVLAPSVAPAGTESALSAIGFLTVLDEGNGYVGGYLVTNVWGRPLEFRLTSAVQPNRVQQILYGETLVPYLCGDLIGKTLVDKSSTAVQLVVTDREEALSLREKLEVPVVHVGDAEAVRSLLAKLDTSLDLREPFGRIREAITEARKLRVGHSTS